MAELSLDKRTIVVRAGLIDAVGRGRICPLLENPDQWSLNLESWQWSRITHENWERYAFGAESLRTLPFWILKHLPFTQHYYANSKPDPEKPTPQQLVPPEKWEEFLSRFGEINAKAQAEAAMIYEWGCNPDVGVDESLFQPDIPHEPVPDIESEDQEENEAYEEDGPFDFDEGDYSGPEGVFKGTRISVDGVVVRYEESDPQVVLTIEGTLPEDTVASLVSDLQRKLEILLARPVYAQRL